MLRRQEPNWQPLNRLLLISEMINGTHEDQAETPTLLDEQLRRWREEDDLSSKSLEVKMWELKETNAATLTQAKELKQGTINRVLEIDDAKLGLAFLLGRLRTP